jgi:purine/pyrimidine-nucleoside phosphorylase
MTSFQNVTADSKANIYFDGKVVSHTVHFADASRKTLGLIYPGKFHFGTAAPERMEIIAGSCEVVLDGSTTVLTVQAGASFDVPAHSGFTITVEDCICEYICSFLPA